MLKYKALVFLQIAIFSLAFTDCMYVFTVNNTKDLLDALQKTETGWDTKKLDSMVRLGDALGGVKSDLVTFGATQRVRDGNVEKNVNIEFKVALKNFKKPKIEPNRYEMTGHVSSIKDITDKLPNLEFKGYRVTVDKDGKENVNYASNHFWYENEPKIFNAPKYNITVVTSDIQVRKDVESFAFNSPTILQLDIDGDVVEKDSIYTEFNIYTYLEKYSSKIPPYEIIRDAMIAYGKDMLPYPMGNFKQDENVRGFKKMAQELHSKHKDYRFAIFDNTYSEVPPCERFFDLKYGRAFGVRICAFKK